MATATARNPQDQHWQIDKSLTECLAHMLHNDTEFHDVTFKVNNTRGHESETPVSIGATRLLLMARSPVFHSMFTGNFVENTGRKPIIDIPDIEPHVFKELLRFIYTDQVDLTPENVTAVLYASKKYMVTNLTKQCVQFLEKLLSANTAAQLLDASIQFDEHELKRKVLEKIKTEASVVLSSKHFTKISQQALKEILQLKLKITREVVVFKAAMKWAENKCDELGKPKQGVCLREVLGECINFIRFPSMSICDFNDFVAPTGVLTESEGYQVMRYLAARIPKPSLNLPFMPEARSMHVQAFDTATRQLIVPPGYHSKHLQKMSAKLECDISRPIQLHKLLVHAQCGQDKLTVSLTQNEGILRRYSGYHPITEATRRKEKHYAVDLNGACVTAGDFELIIKISDERASHEMRYSLPSIRQLSDDYLIFNFYCGKYNPLLGIEYSAV